MNSYTQLKPWIENNRTRWNEIVKKYRQKTHGRKNTGKKYTKSEDQLILNSELSSVELGEQLHRSSHSIICRRYLLNKNKI